MAGQTSAGGDERPIEVGAIVVGAGSAGMCRDAARHGRRVRGFSGAGAVVPRAEARRPQDL